MKDLSKSLPREVTKQMTAIPPAAHPTASPRRTETPVKTLPRTFCIITLEARKRVIVTEASRNRLAQPGWGEEDMNWRSLRQRRRQMEKKGRRQPLKTCAIRMTRVRSAEKLEH